jgi:hypothetical protein
VSDACPHEYVSPRRICDTGGLGGVSCFIAPQQVNSGDLVDLKLNVDIGDCEQGWGNCLDNECLKDINNNNCVKHGVAVAPL